MGLGVSPEKLDLELLNLDWRKVGLLLVRVLLWVLHGYVMLPPK